VRLPTHLYEKVMRIHRYRIEKQDATIEELSEIAIANGFEYSPQDISTFIDYEENYLNTTSLNVLVGEGEATELQDLLPDDSAESVENLVIMENLRNEIKEALSLLTQRERRIVFMRFGFFNNKVFTLEEIAGELDITRERVRQIESKILRKLRKKYTNLYNYLED
jgi:RNA polymerase sigma factor (sigma-70 family)